MMSIPDQAYHELRRENERLRAEADLHDRIMVSTLALSAERWEEIKRLRAALEATCAKPDTGRYMTPQEIAAAPNLINLCPHCAQPATLIQHEDHREWRCEDCDCCIGRSDEMTT